MLPFQADVGGRFSLNATTVTGVNVPLVGMSDPDFVILRSITGWGEASDAQAIQWWWARGMAQNSARGILQSSDATNPALTSRILPAAGGTSDAISVFNTANPPTFATVTGTVTDKSTFVVTVTSSASFAVGDIVRMLNVTAMQQIAGWDFQITAISDGTHITLGMQATANTASANSFAVDGSAATVLKFIPGKFYPRKKFIAGITRAAQARVYFTVSNDFTPGEMVGLRIPVEYGSGAWSNPSFLRKDYRVLSVTNSATESSILLDLDTSGIASAYTSPDSADAVEGVSPAMVVPSSSAVIPYNGSATQPQIPEGTNLLDAFDNRNQYFVRFGVGLFNVSSFASDTSDVWAWEARKFDNYRVDVF
jgi:hypothetical protein